MWYAVLIFILAIALFSVLAFRQVSALILAPVVTVFVAICFQLPIRDSLLGPFMSATADYARANFFVFFVGALFGAIYQYTDAATSIAIWMSSKASGKFIAPLIMIITGILTFGGVSGFVVFFVMYPIAVKMFKEANISRILIPASISAGTWTWSMSSPGCPAIQNVIPMTHLGTTASAALVPGAIAGIAQFIMIFIWLEYRNRSLAAKGHHFDDPTLTPLGPDDVGEIKEDLPNPLICFIPIITILVVFNLINHVETAVMAGIILSVIFFFKRIPSVKDWINVLNKGASNSGSAILNTAIVVGFAGLIRTTEGFGQMIEGLKSLSISPMVFVAVTVAIAAGAAGSASGGLGVAFTALKDTYLSLGLNPEHIHRIASIASGTLDTLPHQGAQITLLGICKLTHKEAYFDIAITQIVVPILSLFVFIPLASMGL